MNTHDRGRLADALNRLRPDWPLKQLTTLLADDRLSGRPLRDLAVALTWVACETGTASPYRVLEAGPWWRAVAVDGEDRHWRDVAPVGSRCTTCGLTKPECTRRYRPTGNQARDEAQGRHEFARPIESHAEHVRTAVTEIKGHVAPLGQRPARALLHPDPTHEVGEPEEVR